LGMAEWAGGTTLSAMGLGNDLISATKFTDISEKGGLNRVKSEASIEKFSDESLALIKAFEDTNAKNTFTKDELVKLHSQYEIVSQHLLSTQAANPDNRVALDESIKQTQIDVLAALKKLLGEFN